MRCPYCYSERTRKRHFTNAGTQRYHCNNCKRSFVEKVYKQVKIDCPYCGWAHIKLAGYTKAKTQRYFCKDCHKSFTEGTLKKEPLNVTCTGCGSHEIIKAGFTKGIQRYKCKICDKVFQVERHPRQPEIIQHTCPYCFKTGVVKAGISGNGTHYYKCISCGKRFKENQKYNKLSQAQIRQIRRLYFLQTPRKVIQSMTGATKNHVRYYIEKIEGRL